MLPTQHPQVGAGDLARCVLPELGPFNELISETVESDSHLWIFIVLDFILVIFLSAIPECYTGNKNLCLFLPSYWLFSLPSSLLFRSALLR